MNKEVVIVAAVRTPIGSFGGALKDVAATRLGAIAIVVGIENEDGVECAQPMRVIRVPCIVGQSQFPFAFQGMADYEDEKEQNGERASDEFQRDLQVRTKYKKSVEILNQRQRRREIPNTGRIRCRRADHTESGVSTRQSMVYIIYKET